VVICAYSQERWHAMNAAIASALAQPEADEVIVVVDHNEVLLRHTRSRWPDLRVIPNMFTRGLSGARNSGVRAASGAVIAFLDDDATADEGWLREMLAALDEPDTVAVGGRARPLWPAGIAPRTLPPELLWVVGCSYRGQPTRRSEVRNVMGCSMAFRRDALAAIGGFSTDTGRVGAIPLGGEETDACIRIRQVRPEARILFEPRSLVTHCVSADRVTWSYLRRRSFFEGVSKSVLSRTLGASDALTTEMAYVKRVLPSGLWREFSHARPLGAAAIVLSLCATAIGYAYGLARSQPPSAAATGKATVSQTSTP
jgi:GT2 family glycosyltransferase